MVVNARSHLGYATLSDQSGQNSHGPTWNKKVPQKSQLDVFSRIVYQAICSATGENGRA